MFYDKSKKSWYFSSTQLSLLLEPIWILDFGEEIVPLFFFLSIIWEFIEKKIRSHNTRFHVFFKLIYEVCTRKMFYHLITFFMFKSQTDLTARLTSLPSTVTPIWMIDDDHNKCNYVNGNSRYDKKMAAFHGWLKRNKQNYLTKMLLSVICNI